MDERIQQRRNDKPTVYQKNYKKAMTGRSRSAAVKAFCLECMGRHRTEVRDCSSVACPLHPYRPYSHNLKKR